MMSAEGIENPQGKSSDQQVKNVRWLSSLVSLLVPVVLVLTAMRLMMTTAFLNFEYNLPNFPPDRYGFTTEERLYYSEFAVDYLLNSAGISYLGDLRFEDGTPVYNERELHHMVDVKNAVRIALWVWYLSLLTLLFLWFWARQGGWMDAFTAGLARGGWLTVGIMAALLLFVVLSFGVFFVAFHNVFFDPGTWIFNYSDTLIRLFPERFWQDIFIYVGALAIAGGLALGIGFRRRA